MITIIMLYLYFIIQGRIEYLIWNKKTNIKGFFDYHSLRAFETVVIFIGLITADTTWLDIVAHSMIANLIYEIVLKNTWDIRTDRKTFNIFGLNIIYRYWFYYIIAIIGIVILGIK